MNLSGGTLTGNTATYTSADGGAIYTTSSGAVLSVQNTRFTSNTALDQGGAIAQGGGSGTVSGSCFVQNSAPNGGTIWSSNAFTASNNWWNNLTPAVTSNVVTNPITSGTVCPLS